MLDRLGAPWKLLRAAEDFDDSIDRVILPGGESTTQGKLLRSTGLFEPIAAHIAAGKPVFGTCAGMILLARKLDNDSNVYFGALDAVVRRNAYGRQLGSFAATADFGSASGESAVVVGPGERVPRDSPSGVVLKDFPLVFIRGPFVAEVGPAATVERRWTQRGRTPPRQHPCHRVPSRTHRRHPHPRAVPGPVIRGLWSVAFQSQPIPGNPLEKQSPVIHRLVHNVFLVDARPATATPADATGAAERPCTEAAVDGATSGNAESRNILSDSALATPHNDLTYWYSRVPYELLIHGCTSEKQRPTKAAELNGHRKHREAGDCRFS